ncbi:MAG: hypothetical protein LC658_13785 [Bacteroidales bacterium]|nr:hypothetical protein [Bacteroidales bacterium]
MAYASRRSEVGSYRGWSLVTFASTFLISYHFSFIIYHFSLGTARPDDPVGRGHWEGDCLLPTAAGNWALDAGCLDT